MNPSESPLLRLLLESIRAPWTTLTWQALRAGLTPDEAAALCLEAMDRGLAKQYWCGSAQNRLQIVAPTIAGINTAADAMGVSSAALMSHCYFVSTRFWAMRCAQPILQDMTAILTATLQSMAQSTSGYERADCRLFLPRRHNTRDVYVHGMLELRATQHMKRFHLLIDHGEGDVWQWAGLLRCLRYWRQTMGDGAATFPTLMIVCREEFRAAAMLALAQMCGIVAPVVATGRLAEVRVRGLFSRETTQHWSSVLGGQQVYGIDPLQLAAELPHEMVKPIRSTAAKRITVPLDLAPILLLRWIEKLDALAEEERQVLAFLNRNPVVPSSVIEVWHDGIEVNAILSALEQAGLTERVANKLDASIWAATDDAMQALAVRQLQPDSWLRRYRFFRADHERRLTHTLTGYRFFAALKEQCQRRSRSMRKLDTRPGALNTGVIPYYALLDFESEWMASDWYASDGRLHYWRPDGYGALRAGASVTHFWIEIDGTANAPSRNDPQVWAGKLGRLCDYLQSDRWRLRYPTQPRTLVVTTDLRNRVWIFDALVEAARARSMPMPKVWLASAAAVQQRGALAKIWFNVGRGDDVMDYAFENVAPVAVGGNEWATKNQRMIGRADANDRRRLA